jgi:S1-C subfamily serine protease
MNTKVLRGVGFAILLLLVIGVGTAAAGMIYREIQESGTRLTFRYQSHVGNPDRGLIVTSVDSEGPAAIAGVVRGDILQEIDNQPVETMRDMRRTLANLDIGDQVTLTILHGDELRNPIVTLGERTGSVYLGLTLCCGMQASVSEREIPHQEQAPYILILEVLPGTPAEGAGLQEGDRIFSVDGERVTEASDLREMIGSYEPGDLVTLEIRHAGEEGTREISVRLGENPNQADLAYLGVRFVPYFDLPREHRESMPDDGFPFMIPPPEGLPFHLPPLDERDFDFFGPRNRFFNLPPEGIVQGIILQEVIGGSPALEAGLREGDLITALDGEPILDPGSFVEEIASRRPGDHVRLTVYRMSTGEELLVMVMLGAHPEDAEKGYLGVRLGATFHFDGQGEGEYHHQMPHDPFDIPPTHDPSDLGSQIPFSNETLSY